MLIKRRSPFTGEVNTWDIPVTYEQIVIWEGGIPAQRAFPNLTPDQREFIMTGITPVEWDDTFSGQGN